MRRALVLALAIASAPLAHGDAKQHAKGAHATAAEELVFGRAGDPKKATRTVRIGMADNMSYSPKELKVMRGETVRFIVHNNGKLKHEMVIGTMQDLKAHAEMMKKHPGMEHDDAFAVNVAPGKRGILVWQFTKPGEFHFGCLEPGHLEAGMVGKVEVIK